MSRQLGRVPVVRIPSEAHDAGIGEVVREASQGDVDFVAINALVRPGEADCFIPARRFAAEVGDVQQIGGRGPAQRAGVARESLRGPFGVKRCAG